VRREHVVDIGVLAEWKWPACAADTAYASTQHHDGTPPSDASAAAAAAAMLHKRQRWL